MPEIVIKDWQTGIAESPHLGFGDMRNVDIDTVPGALKCGLEATKLSGSTVTGLVKWLVRDPRISDNIYALDEVGVVYRSTDAGLSWSVLSGNTTPGGGQGMVIWKDYLFVARSTLLDVYGPLTSGSAWTNGWQTITADSAFHPMLRGQDDILYGGAGRYVFSIQEATPPFAPGTGASYTFTAQALDLPAEYKIKSMAELGKNLMLGTWIGANPYDNKVADIFPWDRVSSSYNLPIKIAETGCHQLLSDSGMLYIQAGTQGTVFVLTGSAAAPLKELKNVSVLLGETLVQYPCAIMKHRGKICFGLSLPAGTPGGIGVYSIDKKGALVLERTVSTGGDGSSAALEIGSLLSISDNIFLMGWRDSSTYGIDGVERNYYRSTSYGAKVDSALYVVGGPTRKASFSELEILLTAPLSTGQGVRIKYRDDLTSSFTTIGTFDFATYGAVESLRADASIADVEKIQLRIELTTASSSTGTPALLSVTLR